MIHYFDMTYIGYILHWNTKKELMCLLNISLQEEFEYINKRIMNELYNE